MNKFVTELLRIVFPRVCLGCNKLIESGYLCEDCEKIEFITVRVCDKCGRTVTECDCKSNAFHFDGMTAPFYYTGVAQCVVNCQKFLGNRDATDYLADCMAKRFKERFFVEEFDGICAVPMTFSSKRKRGYNQAELLAKKISKRLGIPYCNGLIKKIKPGEVQHKLKYEQRFKNVRGKYKTVARDVPKNIILIDDIRTSGATLDECSRLLKLAGANKIVGLTAAIAQNYIEKRYKN